MNEIPCENSRSVMWESCSIWSLVILFCTPWRSRSWIVVFVFHRRRVCPERWHVSYRDSSHQCYAYCVSDFRSIKKGDSWYYLSWTKMCRWLFPSTHCFGASGWDGTTDWPWAFMYGYTVLFIKIWIQTSAYIRAFSSNSLRSLQRSSSPID